jgi:hypothetical protein
MGCWRASVSDSYCEAVTNDERSDHTIVTSDSLGSVTFWDGASLAQKQTFRSHKADGMCLAIGPVRPLLHL